MVNANYFGLSRMVLWVTLDDQQITINDLFPPIGFFQSWIIQKHSLRNNEFFAYGKWPTKKKYMLEAYLATLESKGKLLHVQLDERREFVIQSSVALLQPDRTFDFPPQLETNIKGLFSGSNDAIHPFDHTYIHIVEGGETTYLSDELVHDPTEVIWHYCNPRFHVTFDAFTRSTISPFTGESSVREFIEGLLTTHRAHLLPYPWDLLQKCGGHYTRNFAFRSERDLLTIKNHFQGIPYIMISRISPDHSLCWGYFPDEVLIHLQSIGILVENFESASRRSGRTHFDYFDMRTLEWRLPDILLEYE